MTLKFSDIMKNFNDETLGIKNEDASNNWYTVAER